MIIVMNKGLITISMTAGSAVGAYLPVILFHSGELSAVSILGGLVGGLAGIWLAVKAANYL